MELQWLLLAQAMRLHPDGLLDIAALSFSETLGSTRSDGLRAAESAARFEGISRKGRTAMKSAIGGRSNWSLAGDHFQPLSENSICGTAGTRWAGLA